MAKSMMKMKSNALNGGFLKGKKEKEQPRNNILKKGKIRKGQKWMQKNEPDGFHHVTSERESNEGKETSGEEAEEEIDEHEGRDHANKMELEDESELEDKSELEDEGDLEDESELEDESDLENESELEDESDLENESELEDESDLEEENRLKKKPEETNADGNKLTAEESEQEEDLIDNPFSNIEEIKPFHLSVDPESEEEISEIRKDLTQRKIQEMNKIYSKIEQEKKRSKICNEEEKEKQGLQWIEDNFFNDVPRKKIRP